MSIPVQLSASDFQKFMSDVLLMESESRISGGIMKQEKRFTAEMKVEILREHLEKYFPLANS